MAFRTCRDDERQGRDGGRLGDLASAGEPLFVRRLQLVPEAPGAGRFLGRRVLGPGAVAANPDPPKVGHNHLGCRRYQGGETEAFVQRWQKYIHILYFKKIYSGKSKY